MIKGSLLSDLSHGRERGNREEGHVGEGDSGATLLFEVQSNGTAQIKQHGGSIRPKPTSLPPPTMPPPLPGPPNGDNSPTTSATTTNNNQITLVQPTQKKRSKPVKMYKLFRSVFLTFPIITPACRLPAIFPGGTSHADHQLLGGTKVTGTLFGYRKGRVSFAVQDAPKCLPDAVIELALQTNALLKEMAVGLVRIALECDKRPDRGKLLDEALWTMYCNGKKVGYGVKREPNEEDLNVMQLLQAISMGAGVLPPSATNNGASSSSDGESQDGELAYMRAHFERAVGSRDSEAFYMLNPDASNGPELSIFFVRV